MSDINARVKALAQARADIARLKGKASTLQAELDQSFTGRELANVKSAIKAMEGGETVAYDELCAKALAAYAETGDTLPHEMVAIKMYTTIIYDSNLALKWAIRHDMPDLLKLDSKAFDKVARASNIDFVEKRPEPRASVTRDLSVYLD